MRVVPPDVASLRIYGANRRARGVISRKNDEPPWPGRRPRGFVLELSGSASITRRAVFGDLRDGCVIGEVGTGTTGETSSSERTHPRPSTAFVCMKMTRSGNEKVLQLERFSG